MRMMLIKDSKMQYITETSFSILELEHYSHLGLHLPPGLSSAKDFPLNVEKHT